MIPAYIVNYKGPVSVCKSLYKSISFDDFYNKLIDTPFVTTK